MRCGAGRRLCATTLFQLMTVFLILMSLVCTRAKKVQVFCYIKISVLYCDTKQIFRFKLLCSYSFGDSHCNFSFHSRSWCLIMWQQEQKPKRTISCLYYQIVSYKLLGWFSVGQCRNSNLFQYIIYWLVSTCTLYRHRLHSVTLYRTTHVKGGILEQP